MKKNTLWINSLKCLRICAILHFLKAKFMSFFLSLCLWWNELLKTMEKTKMENVDDVKVISTAFWQKTATQNFFLGKDETCLYYCQNCAKPEIFSIGHNLKIEVSKTRCFMQGRTKKRRWDEVRRSSVKPMMKLIWRKGRAPEFAPNRHNFGRKIDENGFSETKFPKIVANSCASWVHILLARTWENKALIWIQIAS